jgi:hypothetical protein
MTGLRERRFHHGHSVCGPAAIKPRGPCSIDHCGRASIEVIRNAVCIGVVEASVIVAVYRAGILVRAGIIFVVDSIQITVVGTSVTVEIDGPCGFRRARIKRVKNTVLIGVLGAWCRSLNAHDGQSEPDSVPISAKFPWAVSWDDVASYHLHGHR